MQEALWCPAQRCAARHKEHPFLCHELFMLTPWVSAEMCDVQLTQARQCSSTNASSPSHLASSKGRGQESLK